MTSLPAAGREYMHAALIDAPDSADVEVSVDRGETWHPTTRTEGSIRFLVQGPDADTPPAGTDTITLPAGRSRITARLVDTPEVLIRDVGYIDVR